jgi:hypothetical protein
VQAIPLGAESWIIEIAKRSELHAFAVLTKRRTVERTIAWLNRCRRLAKDWENLNRRALAPWFLRATHSISFERINAMRVADGARGRFHPNSAPSVSPEKAPIGLWSDCASSLCASNCNSSRSFMVSADRISREVRVREIISTGMYSTSRLTAEQALP